VNPVYLLANVTVNFFAAGPLRTSARALLTF